MLAQKKNPRIKSGDHMKLNFRTFLVVGFFFLFTPYIAQALPPISESAGLNEYASGAFQLPDNRICAVFEHNPDLNPVSNSRLYSVCLKDRRFTKPRLLQETVSRDFKYFANPRAVIVNGKIWIYFNAYTDLVQEVKWGRFAFDEEDPETPVEWLNTSEVLAGQTGATIYPSLTESGKVLLSYDKRDLSSGKLNLYFSLSQKGQSFGAPSPIAGNADQVRFAEFYKGPWAFSYRTGSGKQTSAFVSLTSNEGASYSTPVKISDDAVHDTFLLQRKDGDLDVYYLIEFEGKGFSLFRRKLLRDGTLGPDQQLTSTAVSVEKPHCLRLHSGKIFVTLSQIKDGKSDLVFMTLVDDAE